MVCPCHGTNTPRIPSTTPSRHLDHRGTPGRPQSLGWRRWRWRHGGHRAPADRHRDGHRHADRHGHRHEHGAQHRHRDGDRTQHRNQHEHGHPDGDRYSDAAVLPAVPGPIARTTLTATAQALDGLGTRLGQSIDHGNAILADLTPQMPQIRYDTAQLANLADVYANASPDLWDFLNNAVTTARTLDQQQGNLDAALMASIGFGNTGAEVFERGGPYLAAGARDLIPTSQLLNTYSP